jgi:RNA polymerase sigma-70 factor, ECF subfamily
MPDTLPYRDLVAALPRLRRYARVLTRDVDRAADLVQDTLARAWEKRRLWQVGSDLRAWLFAIMHNVHVNQFSQRQRRSVEVSLDGAEGAGGFEIPVRASQSDRVELAEVLAQIERLPVEQREVLLLAAVDGLPYAEIARVQAVPVGTVMSRLSRARAKLRRMHATPAASREVIQNAHGSPCPGEQRHRA